MTCSVPIILRYTARKTLAEFSVTIESKSTPHVSDEEYTFEASERVEKETIRFQWYNLYAAAQRMLKNMALFSQSRPDLKENKKRVLKR